MKWHEKVQRLIEVGETATRKVEVAAGWSLNTLAAAIRCQSAIRTDKAYTLCRALGVSMDWLFDDSLGWDDRPGEHPANSQPTGDVTDRELLTFAGRALDIVAELMRSRGVCGCEPAGQALAEPVDGTQEAESGS